MRAQVVGDQSEARGGTVGQLWTSDLLLPKNINLGAFLRILHTSSQQHCGARGPR